MVVESTLLCASLESGPRRTLLNDSRGGRTCVAHDVHLGAEETGKPCHYHRCGQVLCSLFLGTQKQHWGWGLDNGD